MCDSWCGTTLEKQPLFQSPTVTDTRATSLGENARQDVWKRVGLTDRNARPRRSVSSSFSQNPKLCKSTRQWGSLTTRSWVVTACPTLRKAKKTPSYTPPMISFCRVSAVRREELRTVRVREKVAAVLCWVNSDQCFTHRA